MSIVIDNQAWTIASTLRSPEEGPVRKQGEARIAQANRVVDLQEMEKDVILPSDPHQRQAAVNPNLNADAAGKPSLPFPKIDWKGLLEQSEEQTGLIAIIGAVLVLQAKTSSNFWSTLWKQASQSMMMEVKFAPIIGNAIKTAYQAQAKATEAQSNQSKWDGVVNLSMFGMSLVMAGYMEWNEPGEATPQSGGVGFDEGDDDNEMEALNDEKPQTLRNSSLDLENGDVETQREVNNLIDDEDGSFKAGAKKKWNYLKQKMALSQKRLTGFLGKGMQASMMMSQLSQGITGFFIDSKYQSEQATYQGQEGEAQALSKMGEQYAQFFGQDFSRDEDLRQGSSQYLDNALNILQQAANFISQTVTRMLQG